MKTVLLETMGPSPMWKILDFFLQNTAWEYSLTEISQLADISYACVKTMIPKLEKAKLVTHTKKKGKAKLFKLNNDSKAVRHLRKFDLLLTKESICKEAHKFSVPATNPVRSLH